MDASYELNGYPPDDNSPTDDIAFKKEANVPVTEAGRNDTVGRKRQLLISMHDRLPDYDQIAIGYSTYSWPKLCSVYYSMNN